MIHLGGDEVEHHDFDYFSYFDYVSYFPHHRAARGTVCCALRRARADRMPVGAIRSHARSAPSGRYHVLDQHPVCASVAHRQKHDRGPGTMTSTSFLGPFLTDFAAQYHPARGVRHGLLGTHVYRMLIGACNPNMCPGSRGRFRAMGTLSTDRRTSRWPWGGAPCNGTKLVHALPMPQSCFALR